MQQIRGYVERVVYRSEETGFAVLSLRDQESQERYVVVGNLALVEPHMFLTVQGEVVHHPQYGQQIRAVSFHETFPSSKMGVARFLRAFVSGVGEKLSHRIAETLGESAIEKIHADPTVLRQVPGLPARVRSRIHRFVQERFQERELYVTLFGLGLTPRMIHKLTQAYGAGTLAQLRSDPYQLCWDIEGIGFVLADRIAHRLGVDPAAASRREAGIRHVLSQAVEAGHCYLPRPELLAKVAELLRQPENEVNDALERLLSAHRVVLVEERYVGLPYLDRAERAVAKHVQRLLANPVHPALRRIPQIAGRLFRAWKIKPSAEQTRVLLRMVESKVHVLTGGPGTGKTFCVRGLLEFCEEAKLRVELCAPTGRAAKRLTQLTGREARTIHRLLEYNPMADGFARDATHPLDADVVIVDEMSMVDLLLFASLLEALPDLAHLYLVGDVYQLPAVGPGQPLHDLISSRRVPVSTLTQVFRQEHQALIENAHRILNGAFPENVEGDRSFVFIPQEDPEKIHAVLLKGIERQRLRPQGRQLQVIAPMHKGLLGVKQLNVELQALLNPEGEKIMETPYRKGDRVMQIKNNYKKDVFNGDVGRMVGPNRDGELLVAFEERLVAYRPDELDQLTMAYAVTVHKAQGSEFDAVVIPLSTAHFVMLQRPLLYTAVTRAKAQCTLIGSPKAVALALKNNPTSQRVTRLFARLRSEALD